MRRTQRKGGQDLGGAGIAELEARGKLRGRRLEAGGSKTRESGSGTREGAGHSSLGSSRRHCSFTRTQITDGLLDILCTRPHA